MAPDVVYVVRPGDNNEELRYSLRSLANLPHGRVWIAGHCPPWVTGVERIEVAQGGTKWANAWRNLRTALAHPGLASRLIVMNDDFYALRPGATVDPAHSGLLAEKIADYRRAYPRSSYTAALGVTADLLADRGALEPLSYELHTPFPATRDALAATLDEIEGASPEPWRVHWRTWHGNRCDYGGRRMSDVKIYRGADVAQAMRGAWASSSDRTWSLIARHMARRFPSPCGYEL